MFVADLLAALESAHPGDSVRILTSREGVGDQIAAVKVEDAMVVAGEPRTVLIKPAVELRERAQEQMASAVLQLHEVQLAIKKAVAYRAAADKVMRNAYFMLLTGQTENATRYLRDHLPENRSIADAIAAVQDTAQPKAA